MKTNTIAFFALLLLTSCASTMVQGVKDRPAYAPKNYQQKGIVKYLNAGADFIIKSRRESAFKEMHEACGGEYEVVSEGKNPNSKGSSGMGYNYDADYVYLEFQCSKA